MTSVDDPYLYDDDPYDTHKDDCACGHRRSGHAGGRGPCNRTRIENDRSHLPEPDYGPKDPDADPDDPWGGYTNPFAWPINWPPQELFLPKVEKPCPCTAFAWPEPDPSDDY